MLAPLGSSPLNHRRDCLSQDLSRSPSPSLKALFFSRGRRNESVKAGSSQAVLQQRRTIPCIPRPISALRKVNSKLSAPRCCPPWRCRCHPPSSRCQQHTTRLAAESQGCAGQVQWSPSPHTHPAKRPRKGLEAHLAMAIRLLFFYKVHGSVYLKGQSPGRRVVQVVAGHVQGRAIWQVAHVVHEERSWQGRSYVRFVDQI